MPQGIPANGIVELTAVSRYQDQVVLNVFHYLNIGGAVSSPGGDGELSTMISNFWSMVWNEPANGVLVDCVNTFTTEYVKAQVVSPTRQYYYYVNFNQAGLLVEAGVPADVQISMIFRRGVVGRGVTGNKKFTGLPVSGLNGGLWSAGVQTAWGNKMVLIRQTLNGVGGTPRWEPVVWSHKNPSVPGTIIGSYINNEVRVLPSRRFREGI